MQGKDNKTKRKTYKNPQLEQVKLVAEEAVLAGCKTVVGPHSNKNNGSCNPANLCLAASS